MAINVGNLMATLNMNTAGFRKGVAESRTGVEKMKSQFAGLKTAVIASTAAIGAAVVGVGVVSVKTATDFQKSMSEVFTLLPNASKEMFDNLNQQSKDFALKFGVSLDDVSGALYQTISAGVDATEAFDFLTVAQKAASGGVTELATAVDGITSVVNSYGSDVISATEASDLMFTAVRLGKTTFEELSSQISDVVPTATSIGLGFENITAALATITAQGTSTQKATTFLNQALSELSKTGQKGFESFKLAAGKTFPEFIAEGGNLSEAMQMLSKYSEDSGTSMIDMFGSVEASKAIMQLTGKGAEKFASDLDAMTASTGATDAAFEKMSGTFAKRIDKLKARFEVMGVSIGEAIIPHLEKIMDWVDANEEEFIAPILAAFGTLQGWWTSSGQEIIGAIVDGFVWLREAFQPFVDMFLDFWGNQAQKMTEFWETDGAVIMAALENIRAAFQIIIEYIAKGWEWLWPHLENILGPAIDILLDIIGVFAAIFAGDWDKLGERLGMISLHTMDLLYGIISLGFDTIVGLFAAIANGVVGIMAAAWNAILSGMEGMINTATGLLNGLITEINRIPGVNVGLIGQVTFERAEAPKVELPTMADLFGGKKPSEIWGPSREFEPEPAAEEEMALETSPISARDKAPEKPAAVAIEIPEPPAAEAPVPVEIPEPPVIEPPAPVEIPEPLAAEAPLPVETPEFPPIPEGISESAFSDLVAVIKSFSISPIVDAIVNARDMVLAAMGYEIVIPAVPGQVTNNKETVISEVLPEAPAEEEAIVPDIQTRTKTGEGATKPAGSIVETIRSVGDSVIAAIKSSSKKADLDSSAYRNTTNFPEVTKSLKNLRTELITVTTPPPPQVTPTPAVTRTEEASQDLHITTEIDGYAVGQAIYRNWTQRTGGGVNI